METINVNLSVPKESKEIVDFVANTVKMIIAKKSKTEIISVTLAGLITAVEGYEKVQGEVTGAASRDDLAAYVVRTIVGAFEQK